MKNFNEEVNEILTTASTLHNLHMMYKDIDMKLETECELHLFDNEDVRNCTDKERQLLENLTIAIYRVFAYNSDNELMSD